MRFGFNTINFPEKIGQYTETVESNIYAWVYFLYKEIIIINIL